ncbi:MAG: molybdenum cofactor guanylyltransferase [Alphaproteobacteria bacterium]
MTIQAAVILAGGKSVRMGQDKSELIWQGQILWEYQEATVKLAGFDNILVARNKKGFLQDNPDFLYMGPLAGFEAALKRLQTVDCQYLLCLPVDMPLVTVDMLKRLMIAAAEDNQNHEVITYRDQVFPLILNVSAYDKLVSYLKERRSVKGFIESLSHLSIMSHKEDDFRNTNTLQEWQEIQ